MKKVCLSLFLVLLVGLSGKGYGLASEHIGPRDTEKTGVVIYFENSDLPGIGALQDHPARVYSRWVNGREDIYYAADIPQANELLALYAELPLGAHLCLIDESAQGQVCTFKLQEISYTMQLAIPQGIYLSKAHRRNDNLYWPTEVQLVLTGHDAKAFAATLSVPENVSLIDKTAHSKERIAAVVTGNTAFAFDLYAQLKSKEGNLFLSPYSISTALAMTWAGARGQTEQQMARTLHFPQPQEPFHKAYGHLIEQFNTQGQKGDYQLSIANALWLHKQYQFLPEFLNIASTHYDASLQPVDYVNETEKTRQTINDWTAKRTQDKIKDLIPKGVLNAMTRLVLTNAIYFKGDWALQFDVNQTREALFSVSSDKRVNVPLMHQKEKFKYGQTQTHQMLELSYKGEALSMLVLLPKTIDGLTALEKTLTVDNLTRWQKQMRTQEVLVYLPKFKIAAQFGLNQTLSAMGMPDAFGRTADFSGMDGTKDLHISDVIHKAFVEVNEEGTEAAAATGVIISITSMPPPPPVFRADRPFVFVIKDNTTGSIFFMGRVADPTQE